jgi:hypothetical protein
MVIYNAMDLKTDMMLVMASLTLVQKCGCIAYMHTKLNIWLSHFSNLLEVVEFKGISLKLTSTNKIHKNIHIILN